MIETGMLYAFVKKSDRLKAVATKFTEKVSLMFDRYLLMNTKIISDCSFGSSF